MSMRVLQLRLLPIAADNLVHTPRITGLSESKVYLFDVGQVAQHVTSWYIVRQHEYSDCFALLAGEAFLVEDEVDHDVMGFEGDDVRLER